MAYTFRGIGAMHYGKRDFRPDGSYVTTLWFVCFYIPIIPMNSKRIGLNGESKYYGLQRVPTAVLYEKTKPNTAQVLATYSWFACELAIFITAKVTGSWWLLLAGIALIGMPWLLRKRALDRLNQEQVRRDVGLLSSVDG